LLELVAGLVACGPGPLACFSRLLPGVARLVSGAVGGDARVRGGLPGGVLGVVRESRAGSGQQG
jgi:hypothetical protein